MSKTQQGLDKAVMEILSDSNAGTPEDKMRLFIIYYICSMHISESDLNRYEAVLTEAGCDLTPIPYIKRWK